MDHKTDIRALTLEDIRTYLVEKNEKTLAHLFLGQFAQGRPHLETLRNAGLVHPSFWAEVQGLNPPSATRPPPR